MKKKKCTRASYSAYFGVHHTYFITYCGCVQYLCLKITSPKEQINNHDDVKSAFYKKTVFRNIKGLDLSMAYYSRNCALQRLGRCRVDFVPDQQAQGNQPHMFSPAW